MKLRPLYTKDEITRAVERLATEIRQGFLDKDPVLVCVLKGAFIFFSDLVKALKMPATIAFIQAECYGMCHTPKAEVTISMDTSGDIKGRHVIVIEDIVDRGATATAIIEHLKARSPAGVSLCALLLRKGASIRPDFAGMEIPEGFVAGYGMDFKERYRTLDGIYVVEE
jgi:hypoxanthine phosphoribosyltransferase